MPGFIIVMIVLLCAVGGATYYIAHRIYHGVLGLFPNAPFWPVLVFFVLMSLLMVFCFVGSVFSLPARVKYVLGCIGFSWMGIFLYLLLYTAGVDLLTLMPRLIKLPFTTLPSFKSYMSMTVLVLTAVTSICGFWNARHTQHVSYEVNLSEKADISDLQIVLISDLHLGSVGSEARLENIVNEINALKPDIVCIAGDFFDTDFGSIQDSERALATIKKLRPVYGTYACLGNHDAGKTVSQMTAFLKEAGIHLLLDEAVTIDNRLTIVGRLDASPIGDYGNQQRRNLSDFFTPEDPSLPVIVLDHNPGNVHTYGTDADLILCGHTHEGQLFPGSLITGSMYDVDYGYYRKDAQSPHVVVTSGVGYWGVPMRVGTQCEIVSIRCTSEEPS